MTTRNRKVLVWALGLAGVMTTTAAAQQRTTPSTTPQQTQIDRYVVGQAKPPEVPGAPVKELSLQQAIDIALEKNLDLKAQRLNPAIQDYVLQSFRAAYRPTLTGTYGYTNAQSPITRTLDALGGTQLIEQTQNFNTGITQSLPWHGASFSTTFNNSRKGTSDLSSKYNPNFSSTLNLTGQLPLLHNFAIDNNRNRLRTQQVQRHVTDVQLLQTIENTKASVRTAYWNLRSAIESIEINRRSLDLATRQYEDNKIKVEIGTMAQIDQIQSETQMVNAEQALLQAQNAWQQAELALKRLLVSGTDDDLYRSTINPIDQVVIGGEPRVDVAGAIQTALGNRTDLEVARRNLEISQLNLEVTKNAILPDLNLSGGYRITGSGGPQFSNGVLTTPGGYSDALAALSKNPTWNFQFQLSYPLGMAAARASLAQAQLQLEQSKATIEAQKLTVSTDVTNAGLAVTAAFASLQAAKKAREVAERNAEAEQTKFENGMSNNYNVAIAQNNLTTQRLNELRAMITYVNAVADFEKKQRIGG